LIIDAHAHIGNGRYKNITPNELLHQMDDNGINHAVICPIEEQITAFNRDGNDYILKQVGLYPDRFTGFAVANPWFGDIALVELKRAIEGGLRGLKLHPTYQGFSMNDPIIYPFIELVDRYKLPVYAHTGTAHFGEPFKLVELARMFPEVVFIMGHSGSSDFWSDLSRSHQFAPNILFETSRNGPSKYVNLLNNIGPDYIIFGSNIPETFYHLELTSIYEVIENQSDLEKILWKNMARVLGMFPS
jgi:uncharacterized protein